MTIRDSLLLIIPAIIILIIVFPIMLEVRVSYNPFENRGAFAIFFYKFKLLYYRFELHSKYITLKNDTETKKVDIEINSPQFELIEEFVKQAADKIRLKHILVYYNIGIGDAFRTAMLCGFINQIFGFLFLYLKSKKPTASLCIYDTISYNNIVFELAARGKISISLFDLVYSFVYSYIITKIAK